MSFLSKYINCCPGITQFGHKITSFWPTWTQIISVCEFRLLQKHSKIMIDLLEMVLKPGMLFTQKFVIKTHHYLPNWCPNCAILEQIMSSCVSILVKITHGHAFSLLQTFVSQNQLISKVYTPREGNHTCLCYPNTSFTTQATSNLGVKSPVFGLLRPK